MALVDFTVDLSVSMVYIIGILCARNPVAYAMGKKYQDGLAEQPENHGSRIDDFQRMIPQDKESA